MHHKSRFSISSYSTMFAVVFTICAVFSVSFDAQADATWKNLHGYSACGGVDQQGRLQPSCDFQKAKYVKQSIKKCPSGSFAAAGACYSCPSGYKKDAGRKISHDKACFKKLSKVQTSSAKKLESAKCPSGSFYDKRNGGECWKCPKGFGRTAAAVDKYNACGAIAKKARGADFVNKACPISGSFRDPRNGGECWQCPEEYSRTINPVTGAKACKTNKTFAKATEVSDKKCAPGQVFDLVDGGSCWSCPEGTKRTFNGVKTAKACKNNKMQWVMPNRQIYGLFGLGTGADDILAKFIFERTKINAAIKELAPIAGVDETKALTNAWKVIDSQPWESPILSALLLDTVMAAASKPVNQRTKSEKNLLDRVAQLVQWNRQFVAHQAKQAHETWVKASKASYDVALAKMGAAAVYSDSMVTPPDYNELLVSSIQAGAGIAGPVGATLVTLFTPVVKSAVLPFRAAVRKASIEVAKGAAKSVIGGGSTTTMGAAAIAAPMMILAAATVIVTMEIDKFIKLAEAEGEIRHSVNIANKAVNLDLLLQQKNGPDELAFHWGTVIGAATKPSANFKTLLAAYKSGGTTSTEISGDVMSKMFGDAIVTTLPSAPSGTSSSAGMTTGTTSTELSGGLSGAMANLFGGANTTTPAPATTATTTTTTTATTTGTTSTKLSGGPMANLFGGANTATTTTASAPAPAPAPIPLTFEQKNKELLGTIKARNKPTRRALRFELTSAPGLCLTKTLAKTLYMAVEKCENKDTLWLTPNGKKKEITFTRKFCIGLKDNALRNEKKVFIDRCQNLKSRQWELTSAGQVKVPGRNFCLTVNIRNNKKKKNKSLEHRRVHLMECSNEDAAMQIWRPWAKR